MLNDTFTYVQLETTQYHVLLILWRKRSSALLGGHAEQHHAALAVTIVCASHRICISMV